MQCYGISGKTRTTKLISAGYEMWCAWWWETVTYFLDWAVNKGKIIFLQVKEARYIFGGGRDTLLYCSLFEESKFNYMQFFIFKFIDQLTLNRVKNKISTFFILSNLFSFKHLFKHYTYSKNTPNFVSSWHTWTIHSFKMLEIWNSCCKERHFVDYHSEVL